MTKDNQKILDTVEAALEKINSFEEKFEYKFKVDLPSYAYKLAALFAIIVAANVATTFLFGFLL